VGSSSSGAQLDTNRSAQTGNDSGEMNLSSDEIRQVQIVLSRRASLPLNRTESLVRKPAKR